ncbi:hypothetical protein EV182_002341 [Spiromyces aspiralis]|uniref:Uncharacterized protein n=1 Tax=Spiromyces aspiralis TaxID=68401 RepID=A0ACC1HS82_9FUNG|nr:hypothetical protein EV182_002341 [Spiromyces aspiralis]
MDEATSHMDHGRDRLVQNILAGPVLSGKTIVTIAHRLRTIIDYDMVVVMDRGRVVETGSPLVRKEGEGSRFYDMCKDSNDFDYIASRAGRGEREGEIPQRREAGGLDNGS